MIKELLIFQIFKKLILEKFDDSASQTSHVCQTAKARRKNYESAGGFADLLNYDVLEFHYPIERVQDDVSFGLSPKFLLLHSSDASVDMAIVLQGQL